MEAKQLDWALRAIQCFEKKSGAAFFEFERRMIATAHSLKRLATQLNSDLIDKRVLVPHWPDAGFYLNINIAPLLKEKSFQNPTAFVQWAAKEHSLLLLPGSYYGEARSIAISYAASNPYMDQFASALGKALK